VLLTDGFYEYQNSQRRLFGQERISEIILRHHHEPAAGRFSTRFWRDARIRRQRTQLDDMTGVIIRRLPQDG